MILYFWGDLYIDSFDCVVDTQSSVLKGYELQIRCCFSEPSSARRQPWQLGRQQRKPRPRPKRHLARLDVDLSLSMFNWMVLNLEYDSK